MNARMIDRADATDFQKKVWKELLKIPMGRTMSYSELARRVGKPGAARAVGNAVGKNPFAPAVPCHRVIRSDGSIGGYAFGVAKTRKLLAREKEKSSR